MKRSLNKIFTINVTIRRLLKEALKKAEALRQSILKKTFSGGLTEDWRETHPELISGENSAKKLMERIKAEKARLDDSGKKQLLRKTKNEPSQDQKTDS